MKHVVLIFLALASSFVMGSNYAVSNAAGDNLMLSVSVFLEGSYNGNFMSNTPQLKRLLNRFKYEVVSPGLEIDGVKYPRMNSATEVPEGSVDVIKILLRQSNTRYSTVDSVVAWLMKDGSDCDFATGSRSHVIFPWASKVKTLCLV